MSLREQLKNGEAIVAIDDPDTIKDVPSLAGAKRVAAIKVGLSIILACDLKVIQKLKHESGKYLILDLKISDIPKISGLIIDCTKKLDHDALIVQGFVGKQVIEKCVKKCEDSNVMIFVITGMTHEDSECHLTNKHAIEIATWAKEAGAHGIIVPGNNSEDPEDRTHSKYLARICKLKKTVGDDLLVIAAGVGAQGGDPNTCTNSGANCAIIGIKSEYLEQFL